MERLEKLGSTYSKTTKTTVSVSVLICAKNVEKTIGDCILSILNQTYNDFELVIIEEFNSFDKTKEIIEKFKDKRIRYFRNWKWLGISKSRNLSVKLSRGEYLFFTDGDGLVEPDWIEQGLKLLKKPDFVGVEGKSYYVSKEYKPTYSDHTYDLNRGGYMTNNIAYESRIVKRINGFDERYSYLEDRDLALRILKVGKIGYNPNMIVYVRIETMTPKKLVERSTILKNRILLFKKFRERRQMMWRIVDPKSLAKVLFPPLIFLSLISKKFKNFNDFKLLPFVYIHAVYERLLLWKECVKERVFFI